MIIYESEYIIISQLWLSHFSFLLMSIFDIYHWSPVERKHKLIWNLIFSNKHSKILSSSGKIQVSWRISKTYDFSFDDIIGSKAIKYDNLINHFLSDMFFANSSLYLLTERYLIDLNNVDKGLLFSQSNDLPINDISNFDVKALNWKFVLNIEGSLLILFNLSHNRGINKSIVLVEPV